MQGEPTPESSANEPRVLSKTELEIAETVVNSLAPILKDIVNRLDSIENTLESIEKRLDVLEQEMRGVNQILAANGLILPDSD